VISLAGEQTRLTFSNFVSNRAEALACMSGISDSDVTWDMSDMETMERGLCSASGAIPLSLRT
jgi:hypothetical protein